MSAKSPSDKRFVVYFGSGPVWRLADHILPLAATLTTNYRGAIFVWSDSEASETVGDFRVIRIRSKLGGLTSGLLRVAALGRRSSREVRSAGARPIIVSYDPLGNGIAALALKWATGGWLICQINGIHWDRDVLNNEGSAFSLQFRRWLRMKVAKFVLQRSDGIRPLFQAQLDGYDIQKPKVVRSYFDYVVTDRFVNIREDLTILFVGTPFWLKGVDLLIEAFLQVRQEFPEWRLQLVGFQLDQHVGEFAPDQTQVEVLPAGSNQTIAEYIGTCGIFVLPSRTEAMGRVLLEAAAAGKPRIGADVGGIPTVIEHDKDGLLFPKGDSDTLAQQLRRLMTSPSERTRLGNAARERVSREFTAAQFLDHFDRHVEAVCGSV